MSIGWTADGEVGGGREGRMSEERYGEEVCLFG